jgi:hypothetical protein
MTHKADFNAEEWSLLLEGPAIAFVLVASAEAGGLRETASMVRAYHEARQRSDWGELVEEVLRSQPKFDTERFRSYDSADDQLENELRRLGGAVRLLDERATPEEADDYKRFVLELAERVAEAHKEGGLLGFGKNPVSDRERAVLDQIAATLGTARLRHRLRDLDERLDPTRTRGKER